MCVELVLLGSALTKKRQSNEGLIRSFQKVCRTFRRVNVEFRLATAVRGLLRRV